MNYKPKHRSERGSRWEWRRFDNWYAIRELCYEPIPPGSITSLRIEDHSIKSMRWDYTDAEGLTVSL